MLCESEEAGFDLLLWCVHTTIVQEMINDEIYWGVVVM